MSKKILILSTGTGALLGIFIHSPLVGAVIGFLIGLKISQWQDTKQTRYIPEYIKKSVLVRYFNMCAVCPEANLLEYHHKKEYSQGGDNSEKNIVPLCPKHHSMVTRLNNNG